MLDRVAGDIAAARALPTLPPWQAPRECGEDDPAAFTDGVTRILDYLAPGDVLHANLSRRWRDRFDHALDPARPPHRRRGANHAPATAPLGGGARAGRCASAEGPVLVRPHGGEQSGKS